MPGDSFAIDIIPVSMFAMSTKYRFFFMPMVIIRNLQILQAAAIIKIPGLSALFRCYQIYTIGCSFYI